MIELNENKLKELIREVMVEVLSEGKQTTRPQYASIKEFCEMSGLTESWFRDHVLYDSDFRSCCYQASRKYYIHVEKGLYKLERVLNKYRL